MKFLNCVLAAILLLILASCTQLPTKPEESEKPVSGIPEKTNLPWAGKHKDSSLWTEKLKQEVIKRGLVKLSPVDIMSFCPSYSKQDEQGKLTAWMHLFAIMAKYESSYNPKTYFMEPPPLGYESIGLFQLSYEDQPNYPSCNLNRATKNLEDGITNIRCAVTILSKLVTKDNRIAGKVGGSWKGGARYWSVLRVTQNNGSSRPAYEGILRHMKSVAVCK